MNVDINSSILFKGTIANGATLYVPVPIRDGALGVHIGWLDAVSSATITLEITSFPAVSYTTAGAAHEWKDSAVSITGPAASAAGATLVEVENIRHRRARLKIVAAAACNFDIRDGMAED